MKTMFVAVLAGMLMAATASAQAMHQHNAPPPGQGPQMGGMGGGMGGGMMEHGPGCGKDCMHGKRMGMMGMGGSIIPMLMMNADDLKLTDEQVGKLHRMMWKNMEARRANMTKLRDSKMALHAAMMDPSKDDASIRAAAKAHMDAFNAKIDAALKERAAAMAVLTDAQKKQAMTLKPKAMMGPPGAESDEDGD